MTKALLSHPSRQRSNPANRSLLWVRKNLFSSWSNSLLTLLLHMADLVISSATVELGILSGQLGRFNPSRLHQSRSLLGVHS